MRNLIALTGPQRSGKNEVVEVLKERGFQHLSLSQPFKDIAHDWAGRTFTDAEKDTKFECLNGRTPREFYIQVATAEQFVPSLWVCKMLYEVNQPDCVIESVGNQRQWWEILRIAKPDRALVVRIVRPNFEWKDNRGWIRDPHPNALILNNGTLKELWNKADTLPLHVNDSAKRSKDVPEEYETFLRQTTLNMFEVE